MGAVGGCSGGVWSSCCVHGTDTRARARRIRGGRNMMDLRQCALRAGLLGSVLAIGSAAAQSPAPPPLYKNPSAPVDQRVEDLLARMTLEEKIAQITTLWTRKNEMLDAAGNFDAAKAHQLYPNGIGQFARPSDRKGNPDSAAPLRDERQTVALVNAIQRFALKDTRLAIPTWFHEEALHGYVARGATHFPQAIAL